MIKKLQNTIGILLLFNIFQSCVQPTGISGIVKNEDEIFIENAEIKVNGYTMAVTNASGYYEILDMTEGIYNISVCKTGYLINSFSENVINSSKSNLNFILKKKFLTIDLPKSSSIWQIGTQNRIVWFNNYSENVKIELFKNTNFYSTITLSTENDGNFDWNIPADFEAGTDYKIIFTSVDDTNVFTESNHFKILHNLPPVVITDAATENTLNSITLNGSVNPNGLNTEVVFEWGTSINYGNVINATPYSISGNEGILVSAQLTALIPGATYYYRAVATSLSGTSYGNNKTFTLPSVTIMEFTGKTLYFINSSTSSYSSSYPFLNLDIDLVTVNGPNASDADIDITLCNKWNYGIILSSPDAIFLEFIFNINFYSGYTTSGKQSTKLQKVDLNYFEITAEQFLELNIVSEYIGDEISNGQGVDSIMTGDIIAFETQDSIKGIIKVNTISKMTAHLNVDVKILKIE
jgi:hypothetical protein